MAKIEQEILFDRGLQFDLFCSKCAYNLRTRPPLGICPECGNEYDTRPLHRKGILLPHDLKLPYQAFAGMLLFTGIAIVGFYFGLVEDVVWAYVPAVVFLAFAFVCGKATFSRVMTYVRHRELLRTAYSTDDESD